MPTAKRTKPKPKTHFEWVGGHFDDFQQNGDGFKALCPLHGDSNPSLSIKQSDDGRILIHCHAGCGIDDLLSVVGLSTRDLMPGAKRIVSEYDYKDEDGTLLCQALRYEPKDFRQRRPTPEGGWDWSTKGVRRVLYRLPELLAADPKKLVFVVEGEKDVDRLRELGLIAVCNVGGAGKWLASYNESLTDRHVVIIADNDTAGWDHAHNVARHLLEVARSVKVLELPGLPDKGDVSDWLAAGGTAADLLALVRRTRSYQPPTATQRPPRQRVGDPVGTHPTGAENTQKTTGNDDKNPLGENPLGSGGLPANPLGKPAVPPFPVSALPGILQQYVETLADALPCPVDFPATMMLPVLGACIGRKRRILVKANWVEHPLLWTVTIARSGERKSPAFQFATEPLRTIQARLRAQYFREKEEYDQLPPAERDGTPRPRMRQIVTTDTTIEALKDVLAVNPNGIIFGADELSGFVRSIGQYKGGRGDDRQIWLSIWSLMQIVCNRKSAPEPIIINHPFVAITGGIQPDALSDLIDTSREDGFSGRFLFSWPDPVPNSAWNETAIERSIDYESICQQLYELEPRSEPLTFNAPAKEIWANWVNAHRVEIPTDNLRPTWSKAEGHCARLALILHLARQLCNETRSAEIDAPSIAGAVKIIEYFKSHAHRVYKQVAIATGKERIPRALQWIRRHGGSVTARLARMNGFCKDGAEAKELFDYLRDHGYGTITEGKQGSVTFTMRPEGGA